MEFTIVYEPRYLIVAAAALTLLSGALNLVAALVSNNGLTVVNP